MASDEFSHALDRDAIRGALASLSADHQVVVALRFYRDLTVPQIAERLGIPVGTVQSRLHYALKYLQVEIEAGDARGSGR